MPRLLLGAGLAFWGWRSGHYAAAALLAVLAEAPAAMRLRFELHQPEFMRIADLCAVLFVAVLVGLFATVEPPRTARAVLTTLLWLPAVLMPILLAQQLSSAGRVPLSALFRYVRKRRERDPSLPDPALNLTPIYFAVCLVAASIPNQRDALFYGGFVTLVAWALAAIRPRHASLGGWTIALLGAVGIGYGAYQGLGGLQASLEDWVSEWYLRGMAADPYRSTTDLGSVGRLKMIDTIVLRVYATEADALRFRLLHRASFTTLSGTTWIARNAPLSPLEPQPDGTTWRISMGDAQSSVHIVTRLERGKALLALPAGTVLVSGLTAAAVRHNALGATEADLGGDWAPYVAEVAGAGGDYAPPRREDLQVPESERAEIERLVAELGLKQLPGAEVLRRVQAHFAGFAYATYRDAPVPVGSTALGDFLRLSRSGHCEYFAAATTLALRAAGIPARYATGFAVYEYSALENAYLVRARHAHAWARAHVDGGWVDLDTTPPSWMEAEERRAPFWERLGDLVRWAGFRWSQRGALELGPAAYAVLALLIGLFGWRLARVKRAAARAAARSAAARRAYSGEDSEFYVVEKAFAPRYGARAAGESLAAWATRIAHSLDANRQAALHHAFSLHNRYRFDPAGLDAPERSALRARCLALAKALD